MIAFTDAFALCGWALVLCAAVLRPYQVWFKSRSVAKGVVLAVFVVLLIPVFGAGLPLAAFLRGIGSDLSISVLVLSFWSLAHRLLGAPAIAKRELAVLVVVVSAAALILYPTSLGLGNWDAYRLGWGSWQFLLVLLVLCLVSAWAGLRLLPALVALALLAWSLGLMESGNLWDYLMDPWLSAFALVSTAKKVFIKCRQFFYTRVANRSPR